VVGDLVADRGDVWREAVGRHNPGVEVAVRALRLTKRHLDVQAQRLHC
jgi:hypothetical protein